MSRRYEQYRERSMAEFIRGVNEEAAPMSRRPNRRLVWSNQEEKIH